MYRKKLDTSIWWELFDSKTSKCYYYNPTSEKTVWKKPCNEDIIPLAKLQVGKRPIEIKLKFSSDLKRFT
jgi:hypothetical protein